MLRRGLVGLLAVTAAVAQLDTFDAPVDPLVVEVSVLRTEIQATAGLTSIGLTTTNIGEAAVDFPTTARMIAVGRDTVPDVSLPV